MAVFLLLMGNMYLLMEVPNHAFEKRSAATTQQLAFTPPSNMRADKDVMDALDVHRLVVVVITGVEYHDSRLTALLETWGRWLPREQLVVISDVFDGHWGTIEAPTTLGGYGPSLKKWHHAVLAVANVFV